MSEITFRLSTALAERYTLERHLSGSGARQQTAPVEAGTVPVAPRA